MDALIQEKDPLALARWQYKRYAAARGKPTAPREKTTKIILEGAGNRGGRKKPPARSGATWEDEERMLITRAWLAGKHPGDIAVQIERSKGSVVGELRKIGFEID